MEDKDLIPVNVWLAGRSYRIRINPQDEEAVRKAVKLAEEKIQELRTQYAGKDDQDFMAMCLLTYATDSAIYGNSHNPLLNKELDSLASKIDTALSD
jgi:cell division protein ZapA